MNKKKKIPVHNLSERIIDRYAIIDPKGDIKDWENTSYIGSAVIKSKKEAHKILAEYQTKSIVWKKCQVVEVSIYVKFQKPAINGKMKTAVDAN